MKCRGKLKTGYCWPIFGDRHEVVFPFAESRSTEVLPDLLSHSDGKLLSDGYVACDDYVNETRKNVHAQCWSHTIRQFLKAEGVEPELTAVALDHIRRLYEAEGKLKPGVVDGEKHLERREERCDPIVDDFFEWL